MFFPLPTADFLDSPDTTWVSYIQFSSDTNYLELLQTSQVKSSVSQIALPPTSRADHKSESPILLTNWLYIGWVPQSLISFCNLPKLFEELKEAFHVYQLIMKGTAQKQLNGKGG